MDDDSLQKESYIRIMLQSAEWGKIMFWVRRIIPLGMLKFAYCWQRGLDNTPAHLWFDGTRIMDNDTANSIQLEDDDLIDVVMVMLPVAAA